MCARVRVLAALECLAEPTGFGKNTRAPKSPGKQLGVPRTNGETFRSNKVGGARGARPHRPSLVKEGRLRR
eukprot:12712658-Alexandrium_andersonii.AAC.1